MTTAARRQTRPATTSTRWLGWQDAGVEVWGSVPERVGIAAGPVGSLQLDGLTVYRQVLHAVEAAAMNEAVR